MKVFLFLMSFLVLSTKGFSKEIVLTKDNTVVLNDAFTDLSVSALMNEIRVLDSQLKSGYPIYLFLDTPGGSVQAGLELIEFAKGINRPIHTITLRAASMGFQTVQHLGKRYILEYGILMSHKASGGFRGEFGGGGSQLDSRYSLWLRRLNQMDAKTVERTNGKKTLKKYQAEYDNELWLNGKEAVKNGYADELVTVRCAESLNEGKTVTFRTLFGKVTATFSGCPIITSPISVSASIRTNKGIMDLDSFLNQGGKFGEECQSQQNLSTYGWQTQTTEELCASDKALTYEKINEAIDQHRVKRFNNKNVIKMSFSDYISE